MNKKLLITIFLIIIAILVFYFLGGGKFEAPNLPDLINPDLSSKNCTDEEGTVQVKKRGDGVEYKICLFEDNRQCELDSLLSGDCPVGGLKVTGYITEAATYCAILGGKYEITGMDNNSENGNCSFFSGKVCNVWDLYNGECQKGVIDSITYENQEFNFSLKLPNDWKNKYKVEEKNGESGIRYIYFNYEDANLFKISVIPYSYWIKQSKNSEEYLSRNNVDVFAFTYSTDPARSDKQWGDEYLKMISRVEDIKGTFKITKPYIFLEEQKESGSNYAIETRYPFVGAIDNGQVNVEISNFIESVKSSFKEAVVNLEDWGGDNTLRIYYQTHELNNDFVSIRFEISEYTGGAHPMTYSKSFNYDLKQNKIINLSDILDSSKNYLNSISEKSIQYLLKINIEKGVTDEDWTKEGAGPKEENFQTFTFDKNNIVFYFDPYQVAAYVAGRQEVTFPFSSIKDVLRADAVSNYGLSN
ncbi:DUF333 domain-containing protein [bacterium]|nr:DUF333 domain-containing protein [bacterium]